MRWPGDAPFAFALFDDTDLTTLHNGPPVYAFLTGLGLRVTKSVWPLASDGPGFVGGSTLAEPDYLSWVRHLAADGHEIGFHGATDGSSPRARTIEALDRFADAFGHDPRCGANHSGNAESIYWGPARLTGVRRRAYGLLTSGRQADAFHGEDESSPWFWGDVCHDRIDYWRNFTFGGADTLAACPAMPYHDPDRGYVRRWFASTEASNADRIAALLTPAALDGLAATGGACVLYTHLGSGCYWEGEVHPGFARAMRGLASRGAWVAPVAEVLDHIRAARGDTGDVITRRDRDRLEWRWLAHKARTRSTT